MNHEFEKKVAFLNVLGSIPCVSWTCPHIYIILPKKVGRLTWKECNVIPVERVTSQDRIMVLYVCMYKK